MTHPDKTERESPEIRRLLRLQPSTRIKWGLDRITAMLEELGSPQKRFRALHVGGTNGKGSVSAVAASVLRQAGFRTGLYTSPHLIEYRERVRLDGVPMPPGLVRQYAAEIAPMAEGHGASFFEATTALAFAAFARAGAEVVVVEVGLGGRLDATNIIAPEVCAITNVAYDHAQYLGETLQEIAGEKAGIIKTGVPAVVGSLPDRLLKVIELQARGVGAPLLLVGRDAATENVQVGPGGTRFTYRSERFPEGLALDTPLLGAHQAHNATLALLMLEQFVPALDEAAIRSGLEAVDWPGRFQVVRTPGPTWVFDVAHNTAGARALATTLHEIPLPRPLILLAAILGDKPWREMLDPLLSATAGAIFSIAPSSRRERRWDLQAALAAVRGHRVEIERDFDRALARAEQLAGSGTVIVSGSCYTVGDALLRLGEAGLEALKKPSDVWLAAEAPRAFESSTGR